MKKSELKQLIQEVLSESSEPKIHFNEDKQMYVILDMKNTPFWHAWFLSSEEAKEAYRLWIEATEELQLRGDGIRGDPQ